jgi:hypothetical protein
MKNKDCHTILRTFYHRKDHQMISALAKMLLECPSNLALAARDVVMSDMFEMFKSE